MSNAIAVTDEELVAKTADKIRQMFKLAADHYFQACREYVVLIDDHPNFQIPLQEELSEIQPQTWFRIEKIGRGQMNPALLIPPKNGAYLLGLPKSQQDKYLKEPIEVAVGNGDHIKVPLSNLTLLQARSVFTRDHVRDVAEQRSFLSSAEVEKAQIKKLVQGSDHIVEKGRAAFRAKGSFTRFYTVAELEMIIDEIKSKGKGRK